MPIDERSISLPEQWAKDAQTVIPAPPVPGIAYRNTAVTPEQWAHGQDYSRVADSAQWNQMFWTMSGLLKYAEQYGVMPYSPFTDYPELGICMGADGQLYQALQPSGPNNGGAKPTTDVAYWRIAVGTGIGADNTVWTSFGGSSSWALPNVAPRMFFSQTSGSWTVPENVHKILVILTGGGGSGASSNGYEAGGGSAGGTCIGIFEVVPMANVSYTIGAGGIAPPTYTGSGVSGNDGGNSSSLGMVAGKGYGALIGAATEYSSGIMRGGSASGGILNLGGGVGTIGYQGYQGTFNGGNGGSSFWGGGGAGAATSAIELVVGHTLAAMHGSAPGAGGGSRCYESSVSSGGNGANGCILIIY